MILGTHNTMSYRRPKQWYLRPVKFLARCQSVDYKTQHEKYGVECFDLRVYWDKKGNLEFRHNFFRYDGSDFYEILEYCNENNMYVRILLDIRHQERGIELNEERFRKLCKEIEDKYTNIKFYCGRSLLTWEVIYKFKQDIEEIGFYSSVTTLFPKWDCELLRRIDDWCPWIYSKLMNHKLMKENEEKYKDQNVCIQYDFINIQ